MSRYFIFPPAAGAQTLGVSFSPLAKLLFIVTGGLVVLTVMMRVMVVEASARRFGVFGHALVAGFIFVLLAVIAIYSLPALGGALP